jgi:ABC-type sugar transport system ATPase subunit
VEPYRSAALAQRAEYASRFVDLISSGARSGHFRTRSPRLAAYSILDLGMGVAVWFREGAEFTENDVVWHHTEVALRIAGADGAPPVPVALSARGLCWRNRVVDVDLDVHRGEVTGIAGFVGAGRSELAHLLFGATRPDAGRMDIDGRPFAPSSPAAAIRRGIALLPEDRRHQGSIGEWTVRENLTLAALGSFALAGFVRRRAERHRYDADRDRLGIKAAGVETRFSHLSGGNQQKVVIAKWLATDADILIFDEPTQGVDVGAQEEIHRLVRDIARAGRAVVFISSDLDETLRVSDRIVVMRQGSVVADMDTRSASLEQVLSHCFGGVHNPLHEVGS